MLTLAILLATFSAQASSEPVPEIPNACVFEGKDITGNQEKIVEFIETRSNCGEAVSATEACANNGSSWDLPFVNTAVFVCQKELKSNNPTKSQMALLGSMVQACNGAWGSKEGTMYLSINAFCKLNALSWIVNLSSENE